MPNKDAAGNPYRSKIAAIQEYSNFPQAEHVLPPADIDLPTRSGFGQHTLVGLNVYLLKMAWQFPDVLGIRKTDPMLTDMGIDSIPTAEGAMLDQAVNRTATVTVGDVRNEDGSLSARVTVISKVGHKFPSGVGFRRAFLQFSVLDVGNNVLWSSGRTNGAGVIIDENKEPIARGIMVGNGLLAPDRSAGANPSAALSGDHATEPGADLSGAGLDAGRRAGAGVWSGCQARGPAHHKLPVDLCQGEGQSHSAAGLPAAHATHRDFTKRSAPTRRWRRNPARTRDGDDPDYSPAAATRSSIACRLRDISGQPAAVQATLLLPADAAVLSAGPLLHLEQRRTPTALLRRRQARPLRHRRAGLEAARGDQRAGRGAVTQSSC
jgi:hypothetical protein